MKKILFASLGLFMGLMTLPFPASSQEKSYSWNDLVDWNGISFWYEYLIMSPGYFGPNALPVPQIGTGLLSETSFLDIRTDTYYHPGDFTQDLWLKYQHSFFKGKVTVFAELTTVEYYHMTDTLLRNERKIRSEFPKGFVVGDLMAGTQIQLLKHHEKWPDISFETVFRTASGSQSGDARFTDAPGYHFALSFGKDFWTIHDKLRFRYLFQTGFYAWQTNLRQYYQNDAVMLAAGLQASFADWNIKASLNSYIGYIGFTDHIIMQYTSKIYTYTGDKPLIARLEASRKNKQHEWYVSLHYGIHDFPYYGISLGYRHHFNFLMQN